MTDSYPIIPTVDSNTKLFPQGTMDALAVALPFVPGTDLGKINPLRVWDRISDHADGALTYADTGQQWIAYGPTTAPVIAGGKLGFGTGAAGNAVYPSIELPSRIRRIGARFTFTDAPVGNSAALLALWSQDISTTFPTIPNAPMHLSVNPLGWSFGYFSGNALIPIVGSLFETALATDGTVYTLDVYLDPDTGVAYVFLPDGSVHTIADPVLAASNAVFACWESYRDLSTDTEAQFTEVWADDRSDAQLMLARALATPAVKRSYRYSPANAVTYNLTTTAAPFDSTNLSYTFTMPYTGAVLITSQMFLTVSTGAMIFASLIQSGSDVANSLMTMDVSNAYRTASFVFTGTPGALVTLELGGFVISPGGAGVTAHEGSGRPIITTIEAVQP